MNDTDRITQFILEQTLSCTRETQNEIDLEELKSSIKKKVDKLDSTEKHNWVSFLNRR